MHFHFDWTITPTTIVNALWFAVIIPMNWLRRTIQTIVKCQVQLREMVAGQGRRLELLEDARQHGRH